MAAVTFTRKAAAELRSRFQLGLEKALHEAGDPADSPLHTALEHLEGCFIGTIHSFCARLLRERPVEAGIDPGFEELDEAADKALRNQAWNRYTARLHATGDPMLTELTELGIDTGQLRSAFLTYCTYPDVDEWPAPSVQPPDFVAAWTFLLEVADYVDGVRPDFPAAYRDGSPLMKKYGRIARMVRGNPTGDTTAIEILKQFTDVKKDDEVPADRWPGGVDRALLELSRYREWRATAREFLDQWRAHCYPTCIKALEQAREVYDDLRKQGAVLNYGDLLIKAADLLRDKPHIREYFRGRFTHLLVDEFQDTDPVQAQVMLFLTATDSKETDWEACVPVPGSLFVVGDPKQSIYRFRRADIVTYTKVKRIVEEHGQVLTLQTNFRSTKQLIDWVNKTFAKRFPPDETPESPVYVPLVPRPDIGDDDRTAVHRVSVSEEIPTQSASAWEAPIIAGAVRRAIDGDDMVFASPSDRGPVEPGDFMIITRPKKNLAVYGAALQKLGIPHQVTGGNAIKRLKELNLLRTAIAAATQPYNAVALVAALRSELFGISDSALYEFKIAGGSFSYHSTVPDSLEETEKAAFIDAFRRLGTYAEWFRLMPAMAALERVAADLGLAAACASAPDGNERAGSLLKALELVRVSERQSWSLQRVVEYLDALVSLDEGHDGVPVIPPKKRPVQVMNLHKAKGLEAPIVFLADPTGALGVRPALHIDRSDAGVKGYMLIQVPWGRGKIVIAQHADWEKLKDRESEFQKKEEERLLYVAATRAGHSLIVSKRGRGNPWQALKTQLESAAEVPQPGPSVSPVPSAVSISDTEPTQAARHIEERWKIACEPTYAVAGVKAFSLARAPWHGAGDEHGMAWGSAIHSILQVGMGEPHADLTRTAERALEEQGLPPELLDEALETVRSVMASRVWARARQSLRTFVEVPVQVKLPADAAQDRPLPTVLRGIIDLAFLERDQWVIVDYKTDKRAAAHLDDLVEYYRDQVLLYASAWEQVTGAKVSERGLFFTHCGQYVTF